MRESSAPAPAAESKKKLEELWRSLDKKPPGKIVGVRSKVASNGATKKRTS